MLATLLNPSSAQAETIANLAKLMMVVGIIIFLIVAIWVTLAIVKFRQRPGDRTPKKVFGNLKIEVIWTIIPLLTVLFLFAMTVRAMIEIDPPTGDTDADLVITGHQWWWKIEYPKSGVITANEVHLQAGKKYLLRVTSNDVIHSFWVPALGRKMDAIPGRENYLYFEAGKPGVYHGACNEFCGTQHANMRITTIAQPEAEFKAWEKAQLVVPPTPSQGKAAEGARLFANKTCYNCHTIAGTGAAMQIGPDLTHVASRQTLAAGTLKNTPENLARWLTNPNQFKPGSHMPNFQLKPHEVEALVAYLESLK